MAQDRYHKDRLGNRKLKPETLMLGYGYDPALSEGAVKPPVFLTSTFVFKSAEHGKEFFDYVAGRREPPRGTPAGLVYSRFNHPNAEIVEDRLAIFEDAESGAPVLVRHVGHRHDDPGLRPSGRRDPAFAAALRRDRDARRQDARRTWACKSVGFADGVDEASIREAAEKRSCPRAASRSS